MKNDKTLKTLREAWGDMTDPAVGGEEVIFDATGDVRMEKNSPYDPDSEAFIYIGHESLSGAINQIFNKYKGKNIKLKITVDTDVAGNNDFDEEGDRNARERYGV